MKTALFTIAAAASAFAFAAPASAQYYPAPPPPGYGYGHDNYGPVRSLQARINRIQREIRHLDARNLLTGRQARQRFHESRIIERQLHAAARNGLSRREAYELEKGIARFERQIFRDTRYGRGWDRDGYGDRRWDDDRWERDDD